MVAFSDLSADDRRQIASWQRLFYARLSGLAVNADSWAEILATYKASIAAPLSTLDAGSCMGDVPMRLEWSQVAELMEIVETLLATFDAMPEFRALFKRTE